jgi:hypothetical protein
MPNSLVNKILIAPCGMNCAICAGYLAYSHNLKKVRGKIHHCIGCRLRNKQCSFIKGRCKNKRLVNGKNKFCYACSYFPCPSLKTIDQRYRQRYNMSMIENLKYIKENGLKRFLAKEDKKWLCKKCGDIICCHNGKCYSCDKIKSWKG